MIRESNLGPPAQRSRTNRLCHPCLIGLGLTVLQATRSKELVQLLYNAEHSISYESVLRMENTLANDVLERYIENGNKTTKGQTGFCAQ